MDKPWFPDLALFGTLFGSIAGGVGGTGLGLLGAVAGSLAQRGKGKGFVIGGLALYLVLGAASLVLGLFGLIVGQPAAVWSAFLLVGAVFALLAGLGIPLMLRVYAAAEQRRVEAEGLRRA